MKTATHSRRWAWITGWGVAPDDFLALIKTHRPGEEHVVFAPDEGAREQVRLGNYDLVAGYSLGGLLLLSAEPWPTMRRMLIVAPILAFDAEEKLGGTIPRATRLAINERFSRDPVQAVRLFQRLCGMAVNPAALPYPQEDLAWGLDAIGRLRAHPAAIRKAEIFVGERDPLVSLPHLAPYLVTQYVLPGLGHDFRQLLPAVLQHDELHPSD